MSAPDTRFQDFVILQAQNAGLFLGQIPNPSTGERKVNINAARTVLDSLEMLAEKTTGNLSDTEKQLLDKALVNIRDLYSKAEALA